MYEVSAIPCAANNEIYSENNNDKKLLKYLCEIVKRLFSCLQMTSVRVYVNVAHENKVKLVYK